MRPSGLVETELVKKRRAEDSVQDVNDISHPAIHPFTGWPRRLEEEMLAQPPPAKSGQREGTYIKTGKRAAKTQKTDTSSAPSRVTRQST